MKLYKYRFRSLPEAVLFFLILFLAFALRSQELISNNFLFLIDQGRDLLAVKQIVFDHHLTLIGPYTSLQGVFQGPGWYYLLSIPIFITKGDPRSTIALMVFLSILVVLITYFWTRKYFGIIPAIFVAFLFAVSPEAIAAATYSWNPHPMWILIALYIISFFELTYKKEKKFHLFVWVLVGLMFHFQTALAIFIFFATVFYFGLFERKLLYSKYFLLGVLLFAITFLPLLLFDVRHNFLMTKSVLKIFSGSDQGLFVKGEERAFLYLIKTHFLDFYANFRSAFLQFGYFKLLPPLLFFYFVMAFAIRKTLLTAKENFFLVFLVRIIFIVVLLSFLYPFPIRYWFLTGFQSFYLFALGILLSKLWNIKVGKIVLSMFVLIILIDSALKLNNLYLKPLDDGGTAKIKGKIDALDYIYKDAKGKKFGLLVFTPPVYTSAYDYLIWWHDSKKYGYIPHTEKKGTFYLLIEIDGSKPWSYKGWLETVIKDGNIEWAKTLDSGFIIQRRKSNETI